jgi:hypothetical protein
MATPKQQRLQKQQEIKILSLQDVPQGHSPFSMEVFYAY